MTDNRARSSLLKYRYTKGNFAKFEASNSNIDGGDSSQDSSGSSSAASGTSSSGTSKSSPWMSKHRGQQLNGTAGKKKHHRRVLCGRLSGSDSEEEDQSSTSMGGKRGLLKTDSGEDSPMEPVVKKARPLESSQSQSDSQSGSQGQNKDEGPKLSEEETLEMKINLLSEAFPNLSKKELRRVLVEKAGGNCEEAAIILTKQLDTPWDTLLGPSRRGRPPQYSANTGAGDTIDLTASTSNSTNVTASTNISASTSNSSISYNNKVIKSDVSNAASNSSSSLAGSSGTSRVGSSTPRGSKAGNSSSVSNDTPGGSNSSSKNTAASISSIRANSNRKQMQKKAARDYGSDMDDDEDFDADDTDADSDDSFERDGRGSSNTAALILTFFEEATLEELTAIPGGSKKKSEMIIELRPFDTWDNLVAKFEERRTLSYNLITGCKEMIHHRHIVQNLMKKCEKISEEMSQIITSSMDDTTDSEDRITSQPQLLNAEMHLAHYQLLGLNWLRIMHSQELDGILADEMGLGKTVQTIAFLAHLFERGEVGPHVIVVPPTTVDNWLRELSVWCPTLKVELYFGSQEERRHIRRLILRNEHDFNILLTTYHMTTGGLEDRALFKKFKFQYAIFDEGHLLKNMRSQRFQHLMKIRAARRLLLTGTPLQNNLTELMSLLCFVMPQIFQGKTEPLSRVMSAAKCTEEGQSTYEKDRVAQAKRIMRPFVLRRIKAEVLSDLPKKEERVDHCPMLPEQKEKYDQLVNQFYSELESRTTGSSGGSAMFIQLRKAANHPLLLRNHYTPEKTRAIAKALIKEPSYVERGALMELVVEDMSLMHDYEVHQLCLRHKAYIGKYCLGSDLIVASGKFQQLDTLFKDFKQNGNRVLLFSQFTMMLDILEEYLYIRGHRYIRLDGATKVEERQPMIDEFTKDKGIFVFLLSTRAGGMGINLTAADVVIIHDIDYNPYNDKQAEDRCHRMGQEKKVQIVRLVSKDTVEEVMLRRAQYKLKLERDVTGNHQDTEEDKSVDVVSLLKEALAAKTRQSDKAVASSSSSAGSS